MMFLFARTPLIASLHQRPTGKPLHPGRSSLAFDLARPSADAGPKAILWRYIVTHDIPVMYFDTV